MSTSDLYILNGKSTTHYAEFRNGWGSAPRCWDYIGDKYIAEKPVYLLEDKHLKKVWALAKEGRLTEDEHIAMLMTFDHAYIPLSGLEQAGEACLVFGEKCEDGERVNHWPAFGRCLLDASMQKFNRHARGIALSCTSVDDMWIGATPKTLSLAWSIFDEGEAA